LTATTLGSVVRYVADTVNMEGAANYGSVPTNTGSNLFTASVMLAGRTFPFFTARSYAAGISQIVRGTFTQNVSPGTSSRCYRYLNF